MFLQWQQTQNSPRVCLQLIRPSRPSSRLRSILYWNICMEIRLPWQVPFSDCEHHLHDELWLLLYLAILRDCRARSTPSMLWLKLQTLHSGAWRDSSDLLNPHQHHLLGLPARCLPRRSWSVHGNQYVLFTIISYILMMGLVPPFNFSQRDKAISICKPPSHSCQVSFFKKFWTGLSSCRRACPHELNIWLTPWDHEDWVKGLKEGFSIFHVQYCFLCFPSHVHKQKITQQHAFPWEGLPHKL